MIPQLQTMPDPPLEPTDEEKAFLVRFELEDRIYGWLEAEHWKVRWEGVGSDFMFRAWKDGENRLVDLAGPTMDEAALKSVLDDVTAFCLEHVDEQPPPRALIIVPEDVLLDERALAKARARGLEIYQESDTGFRARVAASPL